MNRVNLPQGTSVIDANNTGGYVRLGRITLAEDTFARMEAALEFVERFAQEDERARAIWIAIKARKKILG